MITKRQDPEWLNDRIDEALNLAASGIFTDGGHHKQWYLDQIVRVLTGDDKEYRSFRHDHQSVSFDEDGDAIFYEWDEGISP